ncbi:MAG: hypothetical protein ACI4M3_05740 [Acutalibacteraceae bacterium]
MKFSLPKSDFEFIKKQIPYAFEMIKAPIIEKDNVEFYVRDNKLSDFEDEFCFAEVEFGIDDDTVNEIGKRIGYVYNKLLCQIE